MKDKTPSIRFKGFTDDWEQRKLSELATMHARIGWQNLRTSEFLDVGDYMLITGTDFEDGKVNYSTCHYVEKERYDQDKNIQIKNGNILITKDGTIGKVAYVEGLCLPATLNAGVFNVEIKDENETDSKYLFQFLKAPFLMDYVSKKATGGTIKHLNQNILVDFPIATPSKAEQVRIGEYFSNLDNLITLHQRKYDQLLNIKKSMLEKMFPKNGKKAPEIRFDGFTDDWEQRKLGELVEIGDIDHRMPETVADGIPYLMTGDFVGTNELNFDGTKMISEEDYCQLSQKIKPEKGDILFARYASVGAARYVDFTRKFLISCSCAIIKKSKKINSKYLYHFITSDNAQQQIKLEINTGSQANIGISSMKNHIVVSMPPLGEQTKIADALSNLDHLITLHQRKLEKLQNLKISMLKQMFL